MADRSIEVGQLREDRAEEAAAVLARAFHGDPIFVYTYPDPAERARCLAPVFRWEVGYGLLFGEVMATAGGLDGVTISLPPGEGVFTAERLARPGYQRLREALGDAAFHRYDAALGAAFRQADGALKRAVPELHWYLDAIGVEPARQGAGIGSALLRAVNARADADCVPIALLTFQPRNVPLYRRHGYEVVCEGTEPTSGLRYWGFRRNPGG